jgi:hypothetical protein
MTGYAEGKKSPDDINLPEIVDNLLREGLPDESQMPVSVII